MIPMTIGEYLGYLSQRLERDPNLANERLYSPEGILFGWEDHLDAAKRLGVSEKLIRVWVNEDLVEGVRSNDHIILPPGTTIPEAVDYEKIFENLKEDNYE